MLGTFFPPESVPGARRVSAFASALAARGHAVTVVVPAPSYPTGKVFDGFSATSTVDESDGDVLVRRVAPVIAPKTSIRKRIIAELRTAARQLRAAAATRPQVIA